MGAGGQCGQRVKSTVRVVGSEGRGGEQVTWALGGREKEPASIKRWQGRVDVSLCLGCGVGTGLGADGLKQGCSGVSGRAKYVMLFESLVLSQIWHRIWLWIFSWRQWCASNNPTYGALSSASHTAFPIKSSQAHKTLKSWVVFFFSYWSHLLWRRRCSGENRDTDQGLEGEGNRRAWLPGAQLPEVTRETWGARGRPLEFGRVT